jgi:adenine-specific DNA-methyltransferase
MVDFGRKNLEMILPVLSNPKNFDRKAYGNIKDLILFYSKSTTPIWNDPRIPFSEEDKERLFKKIDKNGRKYTTIPLHAPGETTDGNTSKEWKGMKPPKGRHWRTDPSTLKRMINKTNCMAATGVPRKKIFLDDKEGKKMQDIWEFKDPQYPQYPTQKSLDLLKFIVEASSNEGDLVLDCFAGSGTTLIAAQTLNRHWVGIDKSEQAIKIAKKRLADLPNSLFSKLEYEFLEQI